MHQASQLLEKAEQVCKLFNDVIDKVTGNQVEALKALLQMTVAVNELSVEVQRGKEMLAQISELKKDIFGQAEAVAKETAEQIVKEQPQTQQTPSQSMQNLNPLIAKILSDFNLPKDLIPTVPQTKKSGQ